MRNKTKDEALRIIHNCALSYKKNLVNKNVMFITTYDGKAVYLEATFLPRNFCHLTGVDTRLDSVEFYHLAVEDRLSKKDFQLTNDGLTNLKLDVLTTLMDIHTFANIVGDYDNSRPFLVADKFAGNIYAAMGFKKDKVMYIPNTVIKEDIRTITNKPTQRVLAIFRKEKQADKYCELTYIAKKVSINDAILQPILQEKVNIKNITAEFEISGL